MVVIQLYTILLISILLLVQCTKKKQAPEAPPQDESQGTPQITPEQSPQPKPQESNSKRCNSKAGLLSDDHDLKSDLKFVLS